MRRRRRLAGFGAVAGVGAALVIGSLGGQAAADESSASGDPAPPAESEPAPSGETDDKLSEREQQLAESQQKVDYANQLAPLAVEPESQSQPESPTSSAPSAGEAALAAGHGFEDVVAEPIGGLLSPARPGVPAQAPAVRTAFGPPVRVLQDALVRVTRVGPPAMTVPAPLVPATSDASSDRSGRHDGASIPPIGAAGPNALTAAKPTKLDDTTATTTSSPSVGTPAAPWTASAVEPTVDQRLADRWRTSPVRGPPTLADALGNDGRTTIWQVAVVVGEEGPQVVITSQRIAVTNAGSAVAVATGQGSAQATGNLARTSVTQVSVVILRGSGNATVHQSVGVANRGLGVAASTGDGSASAVGNSSTTAVDQTVVVIVLGSGHGTVDQSAEVDNAGAAYALATDKDSTAVGTNSTTQIRQTAVVMVHDEDVTVSQNADVVNHGVGAATGATSTGNDATTAIDQTTVHR